MLWGADFNAPYNISDFCLNRKNQENSMTVVICCLSTWTLMFMFFWSVWLGIREGISQLKRLHQIPCSECEFFTNDYRLKCTVRPMSACTEEAIGCADFEPRTSACNACQQRCYKN